METVYMTFSEALKHVKNGKKLTRKEWNGDGMFITMQMPTPDSKMTVPYIYMKTVDDNFVPWVPSQTDLMSEDWKIVYS